MGVVFLGTTGKASGLDYDVKLATVQFTPDPIADAAAWSAELAGKHILVQFDGPLAAGTRERLAAEGFELLDYIPNFTYTARLTRRVEQAVVEGHGIRWFGRIEPVNKIAPELAENGIGEWARRGEGQAQFLAVIHRDEDLEYWSDYFRTEFGAEIIGLEPSMNGIDLIMPEVAYYRAVELDAVLWVKQANRPPEAINDLGRISSGAEVLQAPPYNLSGAGIMVAMWDQGHADEHHPDLLYRVTYPDAVADNSHGTHVAGTLCGDGSLSDGRYRGMAPAAHLLSWEWWLSSSEAQGDYGIAAFFQTRVTNNSWVMPASRPATEQSCELTCGNYWAECATVDNIVRAYRDRPFVICWGAGDQGGDVERSPEFGRIAVCSDSLFEVNVRIYEPVTGISYLMPDTLEPGRSYWRVQGVDRAGNESAFSAFQTFVLDFEVPPVPSLLAPADGGTGGGAAVVFRWATDEAPPYEEAAEFYRIQVSDDSFFGSEIYSGEVYGLIQSLTSGLFFDSTIYYWRVDALDSVGHSSGYQTQPFSFTYVGFVCGDVNSNGAVNIADLTYLIAYLFGGGPPPLPYYRGSVNGDDKVNVSDVTYLIAYLFGGGPAPDCGD